MTQPIQSWWQSPYRSEPSIDELLDDPIGRLIMARDQVRSEDVNLLMRDVAARLRGTEKRAA